MNAEVHEQTVDEIHHNQPDQMHAGRDEPSQLEKQTPGIDHDEVVSDVAGPNWDQHQVAEAQQKVEGETLQGGVEE